MDPSKVDPTLLIPAHVANGMKAKAPGKKQSKGWLSNLKKVDKWVHKTSKKKAAKAKAASGGGSGNNSPRMTPRSRSSTTAGGSSAARHNPAAGAWAAKERERAGTVASSSYSARRGTSPFGAAAVKAALSQRGDAENDDSDIDDASYGPATASARAGGSTDRGDPQGEVNYVNATVTATASTPSPPPPPRAPSALSRYGYNDDDGGGSDSDAADALYGPSTH